MTKLENAESSTAANRQLVSVVGAFHAPGFAVLDGAQFDDLPALLREAELLGRSLFLDHADAEAERAGPWLVALDQHDNGIERVFSIVGNKPAAVFWSCMGADMILYRHLRTINMALLPTWAAQGRRRPPDIESPEEPVSFEAVLFRHWDPRVLGGLLPVLHADQFARLLGPAEEVAYLTEDFGGVRRVLADPAWPRPPSGLLRIVTDQILQLAERRETAHDYRVTTFLRKVAPDLLANTEPDTLRRTVRDAVESGRAIGLTSEQAHDRWAYMMLMSGGRIAGNRDARAFLTDGPESPNERVGLMMKGIVEALRVMPNGGSR